MISSDFGQNLISKSQTLAKHLDRRSGGRLGVLLEALRHFSRTRAPEAAAGLAYYALFSLFPLLLVLIALGGSLLESGQVQRQVLELVRVNVPVSQQFIRENIQRLLDLRGSVGVVGGVGLLWSASLVFNSLSYHINLAWESSEGRGFLKRRLVGFIIVGSLAGLLILSVLSSAVVHLLGEFRRPLIENLAFYTLTVDQWVNSLLSTLLPVFFRVLVFVGLYRWVPTPKVRWRDAFWGAGVAAVGWEAATAAFTWYLSSGFGRYELVYGSLGTIIGLMVWIYLGSLITLFGAHVSAAIAARRHDNEQSNQK